MARSRSTAAWDALVGRHLVGLVALGAAALVVVGVGLGSAFDAHLERSGAAMARWRVLDERVAAIRATEAEIVAEVHGLADPAIRVDRVRRGGATIAAELDRIGQGVAESPAAPASSLPLDAVPLDTVASDADALVATGVAVIEADDDLVRADAIDELERWSSELRASIVGVETELRSLERAEAVRRYGDARRSLRTATLALVGGMASVTGLVAVTRRLARRAQPLAGGHPSPVVDLPADPETAPQEPAVHPRLAAELAAIRDRRRGQPARVGSR